MLYGSLCRRKSDLKRSCAKSWYLQKNSRRPLPRPKKHNAIILEEHRTALEQLTEANKKIVYIEGLRNTTDHWFALLSTKFSELQELQARQEAAIRQADSSSFDLIRHLREEQSVNDSLRAQLSTLEYLKLNCLDEIESRAQQVRLLHHRLLDAESQLATRDTARLNLKQENEELLRQLTDMTTKFNQCHEMLHCDTVTKNLNNLIKFHKSSMNHS
jgi:chromosome segregation ATPase